MVEEGKMCVDKGLTWRNESLITSSQIASRLRRFRCFERNERDGFERE